MSKFMGTVFNVLACYLILSFINYTLCVEDFGVFSRVVLSTWIVFILAYYYLGD